MTNVSRHKVFISFHHEDQYYKDLFAEMMGGYIVDKSVEDGDIDDSLPADTIRQKIRDEFIRDATVTVVLVGACTWQRKHVDWEIGSSLRRTLRNPRCGLLGIILPTHPDGGTGKYWPQLVPPRLADNLVGEDSFAYIMDWSSNPQDAFQLIHSAYQRRNILPDPDNSRPQFKNNRSGDCKNGWPE